MLGLEFAVSLVRQFKRFECLTINELTRSVDWFEFRLSLIRNVFCGVDSQQEWVKFFSQIRRQKSLFSCNLQLDLVDLLDAESLKFMHKLNSKSQVTLKFKKKNKRESNLH